MENDSLSSSSESKLSLPLIVGVLGFLLGAGALFISIKAKSAAQTAADEAEKLSTTVTDLSTAMAGKANSEQVRILADDLAASKQQIEANEKVLGDQIVAIQKTLTAPKPTAPSNNNSGSNKTPTSAGPNEYVVVKNDNLGSIAKKNGISLKALLELNPGVNPTRLQIGQKLKVK